jgi:hypothetical protein
MKKLMRDLKRQFPFARIELTRGGHYRLRLPNARVVIIASTPSCRHFLRNVRTDVRRQMQIPNPEPESCHGPEK